MGSRNGLLSVSVKVSVVQLSPTLYDPTDSSLPGSSVHEILQVEILEWVFLLEISLFQEIFLTRGLKE